MTADERLEQLVRQSRPGNTGRDEGPSLGNLAIGSRTPYPMSPSVATAMASPPRELTRITPISPQDVPITDITSDENGRDVVEGVQNSNSRMIMLNDEVVNMTQRQLTSEFELAEFSNIVSEAEVRQYNLQHELSQEIHMFNEARNLIIEMRANFSIEDQGCVTRIEMLEAQRNEFATGLIEVGNRAEMVLQERHAEHQSELRAVKTRAEEFIGQQNQNIAILRNELTQANEHLQSGNYRNERSIYHEREVERINGLLSDELLVAKVNSQQQENEISLMQKVMSDRTTLLNSEIMGLQSTVQNQNVQIANRSGFTDEEIRNYLTRKLAMIEDEYRQEAKTQQAMIQSEGDVARMYKGRFEYITQSSLGKDPDTDQLIKSLKSRLDQEATYTKNYMHQNDKMSDEMSDMARKLNSEEYRAKQNSRVLDKTQAQLEQEEHIRSRLDKINRDSKDEMNQKDERIAYLSSENDRLRDDRNEQRAYSQELYEELWNHEEYGTYGTTEEEHAEARSSKTEASESNSRISRKEADKVVVPPWPKSHDLDGWKSQLMANVLSACADPDQEAWISWIGESFKMHPDITRMSDSGGIRFTTIDIKLAIALNAMIASSGDNGKEVGMEIKVMVLGLARRDPPQVVKGRQIIAMILESFRSSTHTDLMFTGKHLYEL